MAMRNIARSCTAAGVIFLLAFAESAATEEPSGFVAYLLNKISGDWEAYSIPNSHWEPWYRTHDDNQFVIDGSTIELIPNQMEELLETGDFFSCGVGLPPTWQVKLSRSQRLVCIGGWPEDHFPPPFKGKISAGGTSLGEFTFQFSCHRLFKEE